MKKFFKPIYILILFVLIVFVFLLLFLKNNKNTAVQSGKIENTIILDAGHGGFDGGAVASDGTVEKDINLNVTKHLYSLLGLNDFNVIMTRTTDTGTEDDSSLPIQSRKISDIHNRLKLINSYDNSIFVSIHLNKFTTSTANGAQVFYSKNHPNSKFLGDKIQKSIVSLIQNNNNRVIKQGTKSTYLLHNAKIPAVIVECGFISNKQELERLKKPEYQKQMAYSVYCGILNYYN